MASYYCIVDGVTYTLNTSIGYVVSLTGTGMPPIKRLIQETGKAEGGLDMGYKIMSRKMTLTLMITNDTLGGADAARDMLYKIFRPRQTPFSLRVTRNDGAVRQIDCAVDGEMDMPQTVRLGAHQKVVVPLIAANPIWYEPTAYGQEYIFGASPPATVNFFVSITNSTWHVPAIVKLWGPMTGVEFGKYNAVTSTRIVLASPGVSNGETLTFDLRPHQMTVTDQNGANQFTRLDSSQTTDFRNYMNFITYIMKCGSEKNHATEWVFSLKCGGTTNGVSKVQVWFNRQYIGI